MACARCPAIVGLAKSPRLFTRPSAFPDQRQRSAALVRACRTFIACNGADTGPSSRESRPRPDSVLKASAAPEASSAGQLSNSREPSSTLGRLEMIVGPMFAGKTSELLRRVQAHEAAGKQVLVVKSGVDNRYSTHEVVTHDGVRKECYAVSSLSCLKDAVGDEVFQEAEVIAIDEAQFFKDLDVFCAEATDIRHQTVLVAGLSGDFRRRPFGHINDLLSMADSVTQLAARCAFCKQPALFTLRVVADDRTELVGGADKYVPVCRHHYNSLSQCEGR